MCFSMFTMCLWVHSFSNYVMPSFLPHSHIDHIGFPMDYVPYYVFYCAYVVHSFLLIKMMANKKIFLTSIAVKIVKEFFCVCMFAWIGTQTSAQKNTSS